MISLFDIKRILTPEKSTMPSDDFRIIQSWAEYDETSGKNPENKNLNYLCYELEVMNPDTGERIHLNLPELFVFRQMQSSLLLL